MDFNVDRAQAETFIGLMASNFQEYSERARDPRVCFEGYDLYNLNPLVRWPALDHRDGGVIVPIPRMLLNRITSGIYYDFLQASTPSTAGRFGQAWGYAFEEYVRRLLEGSGVEVMPAKELVPRGKVCDWIIRQGSYYLLIECKTRGLSLRSKITGREDVLRADLLGKPDGSSLPFGVAQLAETASEISRLDSRARCFALLVVLDEVYLANFTALPIKALLGQGASKLTTAQIPDFQLASAADMESLCRCVEAGKCTPVDAALRKEDNPEYYELDWRNYLRQAFDPPTTPVALHQSFLDRDMTELVEQFRS